MRTHITDILDGDQLSSDVFNSYGLHVLSKGTVLSKREVSRLFQHQIEYVDIEDRISDSTPVSTGSDPYPHRTIESIINPKWLPFVKPIYENAVKNVEDLFNHANMNGVLDDTEITAALQPLINNLQMERDVVSMLLLLNTKDDYTYQHSVQVGMLSYYLATWLDYSHDEASLISKSGLLHDIGKSRIPKDILNKPDKLTTEEFEIIKKHTVFGHEIIMKSFNDPEIAIGALQHHERIDGSGYPYGIRGDDIHPYSKIIAVVDIYSAMISSRVYQQERDLLQVLRELESLSFNELDPTTTQTFIKHMIPNFIGKRVELSNGETGIIVMTHPTEFFRPLVKIKDKFIDLITEREYQITHVHL